MRVALIGYGKMGRMIEEIARNRGHEIVSIIDIDNREDFTNNAFSSADVAIEFTSPAAAYDNVMSAFRQGVKVVSGSTGWFAAHKQEMERLCDEELHTLFWSSNFSVGVAIFNALNRYLAKLMNNYSDYDVSITETHHIHKLDAPSGTAITLAEDIVERLDRKSGWAKRSLISPAGNITGYAGISPELIPIDSIRRDEVAGIHSVAYDSEADSITITHDAHSRKGFALGAVLAAEYTAKHEGLLTMQDLFPF